MGRVYARCLAWRRQFMMTPDYILPHMCRSGNTSHTTGGDGWQGYYHQAGMDGTGGLSCIMQTYDLVQAHAHCPQPDKAFQANVSTHARHRKHRIGPLACLCWPQQTLTHIQIGCNLVQISLLDRSGEGRAKLALRVWQWFATRLHVVRAQAADRLGSMVGACLHQPNVHSEAQRPAQCHWNEGLCWLVKRSPASRHCA